jgi:dipeptidyl aminopeptidase/acylaminoacyl peptidase
MRPCRVATLPVAVALAAAAPTTAWAQPAPAPRGAPFTLADVRAYPYANELVAAARAPRVAWMFNAEGRRNLWTASAPDWRGRQVTQFLQDDGQEVTSVSLAADGRHAVLVRGGDHDANWDLLSPVNATSRPMGAEVAIWIVPLDGGAPRSIGDGDTPVIAPQGDRVAFVRDRQLWLAPIDGSAPPRRLVTVRGDLREPQWSPDGTQLAFVADRGDHAFVGVYTNDTTPIRWMAPSTGRDNAPRWSPDGRRLAFVRRPGVGGPPDSVLRPPPLSWRLMVADVATGEGRTVWKAPATRPGGYARMFPPGPLYAANGRLVFRSYQDGWPHLYLVSDTGGAPRLLTPGAYMVEEFRLTPDGRGVLVSGNAGDTPDDIDRRHLVHVDLERGTQRVLTPGTGLEYTPVMTGDGATIAFLGATAQQPPMPMRMALAGGAPQPLAAAALPARFPQQALVTPRVVTYRAPDGLLIRAQLFERAGGPARKPAVIFGHGGPERQMLLGWHNMEYYVTTYAMTQYLAAQGYVVLVPNYRLGIGYGFDFHQIVDGWSRGASEYQDIVAAAHYLRALPQVDAARLGIFGGSYGGFLTGMALARNSDLFAVGVDMMGPSDWTADDGRRIGGLAWDYEKGDRAASADVAFRASPVAWVDGWRSPVLFIHGDDDRNTRFYHTIDLVRRLEVRGVPYEELIIPDDNHHWVRHVNSLRVWQATADFLGRHLRP